MEETLKQTTAKSMAWSAVNSGATQLLNLALGIVLARLLTPSDYGIVGVLTVFTVMASNIQAFGFAHALINRKEDRRADYNAVFWFNVAVGLALYAILYACAPLIARFFHQPCLTGVSRVLFLVFVIMSFGTTYNGYLTKHLMNSRIAIVSVTALAVSGVVGIAMAWRGMSYWSLVYQQLTYATLLTVGRCLSCPRLLSLRVSLAPLKQMMGFGVRIMFTNIATTLSNHALTFIIGRLFPIHDVGNYSQANKWNKMASTTIYSIADQVVQPVMVRANADAERRKRVFRKLMRLTAFFAFPAMLGLSLVSHEFIVVTIGEKWLDAVALLRILCVAGAVVPLHHVYQNFIASTGRSDIYLYTNLSLIAAEVAVVLAVSSLGIQAMVMAFVAVVVLWTAVWHLVSRRAVNYSVKELASDTLRYLLAAVVVLALTWAVTLPIDNLPLRLVTRVAIDAACYGGAMWLLRDDIFSDLMEFLKKRRGGQSAQSK